MEENLNCCKKSALITNMAASQTLQKDSQTLDVLESSLAALW
jgi:hypothetical protein